MIQSSYLYIKGEPYWFSGLQNPLQQTNILSFFKQGLLDTFAVRSVKRLNRVLGD